MKRIWKWIVLLMILCMLLLYIPPKASYLIIGNTFEKGKDIQVIIRLDDRDTLYNGILHACPIPIPQGNKNMKCGIHKISAHIISTGEEVVTYFLYLYQKTIWIDFDMSKQCRLLVTSSYTTMPL